jgi:hypothetical protein
MHKKILNFGIMLPHSVYNLHKIKEPCYPYQSHIINFLVLN